MIFLLLDLSTSGEYLHVDNHRRFFLSIIRTSSHPIAHRELSLEQKEASEITSLRCPPAVKKARRKLSQCSDEILSFYHKLCLALVYFLLVTIKKILSLGKVFNNLCLKPAMSFPVRFAHFTDDRDRFYFLLLFPHGPLIIPQCLHICMGHAQWMAHKRLKMEIWCKNFLGLNERVSERISLNWEKNCSSVYTDNRQKLSDYSTISLVSCILCILTSQYPLTRFLLHN